MVIILTWVEPIRPWTEAPSATAPDTWLARRVSSGAISGGAPCSDWKDSLFVGALRGQMLDRIALNGKRVVSEEPMLVGQRVRDVRMGPDGAVYVLTDNGKLIRLTPR